MPKRLDARVRARAISWAFALGFLVGGLLLWRPLLGPALADVVADAVASRAPVHGLDPERRGILLEAARAHAAAAAARGTAGPPRHAHFSATFEQLRAALEGDYDSIEGDIGLAGRTAVVRHHVGDAVELTLDEWIEVVAAADFRVVKLDVKRDRVGPIAEQLAASMERHGLAPERLKINADVFAGPNSRAGVTLPERVYTNLAIRLEPDDLEELVRAFPGASVSISAVLGRKPGAPPYSAGHIERFRELALRMREAGASEVVVVARWDLLTPALAESMAAIDARIDVWNSFTAAAPPTDLQVEGAALRERYGGVLGVVDLRR